MKDKLQACANKVLQFTHKKQKTDNGENLDAELAESLSAYRNAILRIKVKALVDEVKVTDDVRRLVDEKFTLLTNAIAKMKMDKPKQLLVKLPAPLKDCIFTQAAVQGSWQFMQPLAVSIAGSYALDFASRKDLVVDVIVVVPKKFFRAKDFLNLRYTARKICYLTCMAEKLQSTKWISTLQYAYHQQNTLRPLLLVGPRDADFHFAVHILPEKDTFAVSRFGDVKNNVRPRWLTHTVTHCDGEEDTVDQDGAESGLPPTPHYNATVLMDVVAEEANRILLELIRSCGVGVRDALLLLKTWLHQRQLDEGKSCISGYVIATFVALLVQSKKLSATTSSYQAFKSILTSLATSEWSSKDSERGGGLAAEASHSANLSPVEEDEGRPAFDVVLLDVTGRLNVCHQLSCATYSRMKQLAMASVEHMEAGHGSFEDLFVVTAPFARQFDCYVTLSTTEHLWKTAREVGAKRSSNLLIDHCGDAVSAALPTLLYLLSRALGKRVNIIDVAPMTYPHWGIQDEPPSATSISCVQFGLRINGESAHSNVDKGPPADAAALTQPFRDFWGEKAELRRFQDGSICEAVVWPCKTVAAKRNIVGRIVKYIITRHLSVSPSDVHIALRQLDGMLESHQLHARRRRRRHEPVTYGTGEEQHSAVLASFGTLCKHVRSVSAAMPLSVVSLQGLTPSFRGTEVFPVLPAQFSDGTCTQPLRNGALEVACTLEGSGKWPDNVDAVRRLSSLYLLKLGQELQKSCGLICYNHVDSLSVIQDGYIFCLRLVHHRQMGDVAAAGSPLSALAEDELHAAGRTAPLTDLAKLTSFLHGVQSVHSSFGASARLAKRWASAHLMTDLVSDAALDLLVAHIFIHPHPYAAPPGSPIVGFFRFLQLVASFDWQGRPLIVNFNNELSVEECEAVHERFSKERAYLPCLFISTPYDWHRSGCTLADPKPFALRRLVQLARESLRIHDESSRLGLPQSALASATDLLQSAFRTSLAVYDIIIHLKPLTTAEVSQRIVELPAAIATAATKPARPAPSGLYVSVDAVDSYIREMREAYGSFALFLYDKYDSNLVAVLWKPNAFEVRDIKSSHLDAQMAVVEKDDVQMRLSVEAAIRDFEVIGKGLVSRVEVLREVPQAQVDD